MNLILIILTTIIMTIQTTNSVHDFTMPDIDGKEISLGDFKGKVLVMVNVASECGNTPQYAELQDFYEQYQEDVVVLGFPANNFGGQEPGSDEEIKEFCSVNYGVTFPMFSKISVKGKDQHPLYAYLTSAADTPVSWNFQKFIVDKNGKVRKSIAPRQSIQDPEVVELIEALVKE
jgi:glutathione peroxidase